ncbi:MAG: hypothetical protein IH586_22925 [Anaerolineaceae bacterium]|nr:hypothetical protein [Anaerolineaceae bacterium]
MLTGRLGYINISDWDRDKLETYGTKLYFALINNHNANDEKKLVLRALSTAPNLQELREIVRYLYKTLLTAEESRINLMPPIDIVLSW